MDDPVRARLIAAGPDIEIGTAVSPEPKAIPEAIVEQAVAWYVQLASGIETAQDRADFARWRDAHPDHALAWARLQSMGQRLQASKGRVAPVVTQATLTRLAFLSNRRQALKRLMWIGVGGTSLYLAQEQVPWRSQLAVALSDVKTSTGERRNLTLSDETQLYLNTATAVDVRFDARERRIVLRSGEIMIATGKDPAGRPFVVATADGELVPVGTRFTVRRDTDASGPLFTQLTVTEGAVEVRPEDAQADGLMLVRAGQQVSFTREAVGAPVPVQAERLTWINGTFAAESMRLDEFLSELGRYRSGRLRCAPEIAGLRITGTWPLDGPDATERILDSLERRLPVKVSRFTRYWITVAAR